jgi:diketogulonate reductase-like aldo/keto reductase
MKNETVQNVQIPRIGFGTWGIGGGSTAKPSEDERWDAALQSALELGYTHFDTAEAYASGHAEELIARALRETKITRDDIFITSKVSPEHLQYEDTLKACERSLRRLDTDYLDLYLIHWPNVSIPLKETFRALNQLVREGKVRHLGVSNFDLPLLQEARAHSETPILTDQVPYNLADRSYAHNGVLEYCQQNDILLTAYTPVKRRNARLDKTQKSIAAAHSASSEQIALAWLAAQPRVITIPMSANPQHQAQNLQAADIVLSPEEMTQLNKES